MTSIYIIMSVLVSATLATGMMECNLTQSDTNQQCYGALGEPLIFHLPINLNVYLKRNGSTIFRYNDSRKLFRNDTRKDDSGVYQLEGYGTDGIQIKNINISLQILAPVSQPALFQTCLSPEQRTVSCSARGEDIDFSFSLDKKTIPHSVKNQSATITLDGQLAGNLQCNVQNKVSSKQTIIHLTSCGGARVRTVIILASVTIPLLLLIMFLCIKLFKLKRKSPTSIREGDAEDEIVYADVRVIRAARKMDG